MAAFPTLAPEHRLTEISLFEGRH